MVEIKKINFAYNVAIDDNCRNYRLFVQLSLIIAVVANCCNRDNKENTFGLHCAIVVNCCNCW